MGNHTLLDQLHFVHLLGLHQSPSEIEELVVKYSKDGLTPSQIGIKLRDQHSIP